MVSLPSTLSVSILSLYFIYNLSSIDFTLPLSSAASAFFSYGDRSSHTTTTSSTRNRSTTPQRTRRDVRLYLSRREWIALSFCFANEVFLGRGIDKRANATEEDEEKRKDAHTKQESQSQESKSEEEKAKFEAKENKIDTGKAKSDDDSSVNPFLSLFDPNEKTKEGKSLPKGYLKSARLVVKSLKESIGEESKNEANIRRSADSAKGAIRDFLQNWRGQKSVSSEVLFFWSFIHTYIPTYIYEVKCALNS